MLAVPGTPMTAAGTAGAVPTIQSISVLMA